MLTSIIGSTTCSSQEKRLGDNFDYGKVKNDTYQNDYFEMEITFNPNWVIQDKQQMNQLIETGKDMLAGEDETLQAVIEASMVKTAYLFTIFKHEVGAPVESNPSFMAVAENTSSLPGIKKGEDYLFHAKKLIQQSQLDYYFEKDFYETTIGNMKFDVMEAKLDYMNKTIVQEYISTVTKGFSLTFIVSYTNEAEKSELYSILDKIKM